MCTFPVQPVCTSLSSLLFILLFIKSHILFLHILLVFAHLTCLAHLVLHFSLFHYTFYSLFLFSTYIYALVWCYFVYNFYSLHCPLSGPDLIYISLLIIPCIIYYVTNKETLTLLYLHPLISDTQILFLSHSFFLSFPILDRFLFPFPLCYKTSSKILFLYF